MSSPVNSLISAIDTHYDYVKQRIASFNVSRKVVGIMDAQDWPPENVQMEALYCIALGEVPIGKSGFSPTIPILYHTVQWTWLIAGTDIQEGIQIRSRGDRYRTNYAIEKELEYGMYPQFAQKNYVQVNASNGAVIVLPVDPVEYIWWSPISFGKKSDRESGLLYGTGTVRITNMSDVISS